jgi:hypothetical protein
MEVQHGQDELILKRRPMFRAQAVVAGAGAGACASRGLPLIAILMDFVESRIGSPQ